ncbi:MAG: flagellar basal body P-ring formation chaperone FlgA, partial [Bdellovibrio sp.]
RQIANVLKARCNECEYRISVQSTPTPAGKQWNLDFSQLSPKGSFLLPLREGNSQQIKWVSGTIQVSRLTPVALRMILQGERIQPEDVKMAMTDVTHAKDGIVRLEDIQGQVAARTLTVGTPVWMGDLRREPAARRGQVVKALIGTEAFEISTTMQAEESGFIGDFIKVKNTETQKTLSGLIIEKGVVKLQ